MARPMEFFPLQGQPQDSYLQHFKVLLNWVLSLRIVPNYVFWVNQNSQ